MQDNRNYTKTIDLSFNINEQTYKEVQDQIAALGEDVNLTDDTVLKTITDILKRGKAFEIGERQEKEEPKKRELRDDFLEFDWKEWSKTFLTDKLKSVFDWAWKGLKDIFKSALGELQTMLDYSRLTNRNVREQAFTFGFSPAENYAYSKVTSLMGINDLEDLMYMTEQQTEKFQERFVEYASKYQELYDKGFFDTLEQYNWEMEEFKEDMQYAIIDFFIDNKEVIITSLKAIMTIADGVLKIVGWLMETPDNSTEARIQRASVKASEMRLAQAQQVLNQVNSSVTNNTTNVKVDQSFNGINGQTKVGIQNAVSAANEQLIRAMGGRI